MNLNILYEDESIIVCHKPAGIASQNERSLQDDMCSLIYKHINQPDQGKASYLGIIHRLDKPVSGILVYAKTPQAAAELSRQVSSRQIAKHYYAVLCGTHPDGSYKLSDYLLKNGKTNTSSVVKKATPGAKLAELSYQVRGHGVIEEQPVTFASIQLETGRHHQIRVQFSHAGYPLWGDTKYNPSCSEQQVKTGLALCAFRLEFRHPVTKKEMTFEVIPENAVFDEFIKL